MGMVKQFLQGLRQGFAKFMSLLADSINLVLLGAVYLAGVGTTSIIARVFKQKFLDLKPGGSAQTYWQEVSSGRYDARDYFYRMF